jgi:hypothetical protein
MTPAGPYIGFASDVDTAGAMQSVAAGMDDNHRIFFKTGRPAQLYPSFGAIRASIWLAVTTEVAALSRLLFQKRHHSPLGGFAHRPPFVAFGATLIFHLPHGDGLLGEQSADERSGFAGRKRVANGGDRRRVVGVYGGELGTGAGQAGGGFGPSVAGWQDGLG